MKARRARFLLCLGVLGLLACGGGGGNGGGDTTSGPPCTGGPYLSVSPVAVPDMREIVPLGNLNPPGHTFPTAHMYFYLRIPVAGGAPVETPLYAPGALTIRRTSATEHVTAGYTDYGITLSPCADIEISFGHVTSLATPVFGDVSTLAGWTFEGEYSTGGGTFRRWTRTWNVEVAAGTQLGTTGGRIGQWALDVGAYDSSLPPPAVANPGRWSGSRVLQAICPLGLYESGPTRDDLYALLDRGPVPGSDPHPCGWVVQDVPGTAQGTWFRPGQPSPYPEDPHLALVWHNTEPTRAAFSVGTSVPGLGPGVFRFDPLAAGRWNRPFDAVTSDGHIYGFQPLVGPGVILVAMPTATTLRIEASATATADPATWSFTAAAADFER